MYKPLERDFCSSFDGSVNLEGRKMKKGDKEFLFLDAIFLEEQKKQERV